MPTASRSQVSQPIGPPSGPLLTVATATTKMTPCSGQRGQQQPHHPAQRRRRQLRRDQVPVAEQHGGVDGAQREGRQHQLHAEQELAHRRAAGRQRGQRQHPDQAAGHRQAGCAAASGWRRPGTPPRSRQRPCTSARRDAGGRVHHRPCRQVQLGEHQHRREDGQQPGHEEPIAARRAAQQLGHTRPPAACRRSARPRRSS